MKQVSQLDKDGYFVGITIADESPLEKGVYLIPAGAVDSDAPSIPDGQRAKWENEQWVFEDIPQPEPEPEPEPPTDEEVKQMRIAELQFELSKTDFKFSQDYDKKDTQEWLQLKSDRQAWRDEIRQLEQLV